MIYLIKAVGYILILLGGFFFFRVTSSFIPPREKILVRVMAFLVCSFLVSTIVDANDLLNIPLVFATLLVYVFVFHTGRIIHKISVVFILGPLLVCISYLTRTMGSQVFFLLPVQTLFLDVLVSSVFMIIPTLLWFFSWCICQKWPQGIVESFDSKTWLLLDSICISVVAAVMLVLSFAPEAVYVTYPVCIAGIITIFGCIYLTVYMANSMQKGFELTRLQAEYHYYQDKFKDEERVRAVYHDMKNHLLLLKNSADNAPSVNMIGDLQKQIAGYDNYYKTGNSFLDVIIRDKAQHAKENKIDFSAILHFEDGNFIDPLDISTIFGNALDNAIEACIQLAEDNRYITIKANRVGDMLAILVENSSPANINIKSKTSKKDKTMHGFGLQNIRQSVKKYGGECTVSQATDQFTLSILLSIDS